MWISSTQATLSPIYTNKAIQNKSFKTDLIEATLSPLSSFPLLYIHCISPIDKPLLASVEVTHTIKATPIFTLRSESEITTLNSCIYCDNSLIVSTNSSVRPLVNVESKFSNVRSIKYIWPLILQLGYCTLQTSSDEINIETSFGVDYYSDFAKYPEDIYTFNNSSVSNHLRVNTCYLKHKVYAYRVADLTSILSYNNLTEDEFLVSCGSLQIANKSYPIYHSVTDTTLGSIIYVNNSLLIPDSYV